MMFVWHDFNALDIEIMVVVVITAFRGGDALESRVLMVVVVMLLMMVSLSAPV